MKQLEATYTKNGYNHEIVWRDEDYAITKLTDTDTGRFSCYEAFKVKKRKPSTIKGKIIEGGETTPCNEEWGKTGYTVMTLEKAQIKINELKNRKHAEQK
jgi:hypothetical protein